MTAPTLLPRLSAYLDFLPEGLASHPSCQVKAGVFRHFAASRTLSADQLRELPDPLQRSFESLDSLAGWLPESHFMGALFALADFHRLSDEELQRWLKQINITLLGGRIYRGIMSMGSPELLLNLARFKWATLHRGSSLAVEFDQKQAKATLGFPSRLFDGRCLATFAPAFEAILEVSQATGPRVSLGRFDETSAQYEARWD